MGWAGLGKMSDDSVILIPFEDRSAWERAAADALPTQSWGHAAGLAADGMTPELAVVTAQGAQMVLPFFQRRYESAAGAAIDIATLPGLSGALVQPSSAAPLALWSRFAAAQGWVSGYIQLSPLNDTLVPPVPDQIRRTNALFVFDVQAWDIETAVRHHMRRNLKLGARLGATLLVDPSAMAAEFAALKAEHLALSGGSPPFSPKALDRWFAEPGIIAFGAELDGQIVNIQMGRRHGEWADLHLARATSEGRDLQAWLIWQALGVLRVQGVRFINIGGYGVEGDGLHWMKSRFGAQEHPLRAVLQIYDQARYDHLCAQSGADPQATFFPQYRAPKAG